ncbi:MAG: D-beta-D-heptose 7-phosphate kinase, partial [Pseudonocardia sp.]|nr:D-beta-D-heptose 7-phosphate kinase [Pseudonocardia sp.]
PKGAPPTPGVRLATPNEMEVRAWTGHRGPLLPAISGLLAAWGCDALAVTCGSRGALLAQLPDSYQEFPAVPCEARDVCGAGDQFAAAAAEALLNGADVATASAAAVAAASRFVADGGAGAFTVPTRAVPTRAVPARAVPTRAALPAAREAVELAAAVRERGGRVVATGGCFDLLHPGHLSLLRRARAAGDALVICLNSDASVRRLKGPGRPIANQDDRVRMLEALDPVDAVVMFDEDTPARILAELRPDVWVKGGDYVEPGLPEAAVVREYGGEVLLLPLVDGYSTSRLVAAAQGGY